MQHEQGLKNVMTCLGTRGEIGLEKVLFGKINLGRPVRLKWFNFESDSVSCFSHIRAFVTPWTVAHQAHLSMEFSRQEYWSECPFPSQGDLLHPGIEPGLSEYRQSLYHLSHQGSP